MAFLVRLAAAESVWAPLPANSVVAPFRVSGFSGRTKWDNHLSGLGAILSETAIQSKVVEGKNLHEPQSALCRHATQVRNSPATETMMDV